MTTKNFFTYQALLNISFGLGLLFLPQMMVDMYLVQKGDMSAALDFLARSYGTALTGLGLMAYMIRDSQASLARYVFLLGTMVTGILVTCVHVRAIFQGVENNMAWGTVILLLIVTAWSGWLVSQEDPKTLA